MNSISAGHKFSMAITIAVLIHSAAFAEWTELFNGTDLTGWRIGENPGSFSVQDGLMVVDGPRAHAFYVGPDGEARFKDFVFETEVLTFYGANSGIYFHTHYQSEDWPSTGYEAQINQTHDDPKKTGGLYGVQDNYTTPVQDFEWFDYQITVRGKRIVLKINGQTITDYTEPNDLNRPWRQLGQGTFAIQSHDPGHPVFFRNMRVQSIPEPSTLAICGIGMILATAVRRRKLSSVLIVTAVVALSVSGDSAHADTFGSGANTFNIAFVTIGNPGNPADTTGDPNPGGSLPYVYRMDKHEISEQMIDKANTLGGLGITKNARGADKPATSVSWNEAARFVNWLNASTGSTPAYKFTIQPGQNGYDPNTDIQLWRPGDAGYNPNNLYRNSLARYFLPSVDEWYKAAYYDPATGVYFDYPTGSNTAPTAVANGTLAGTDVYMGQVGPADITLAGGLSPYGTMGQGGNAYEWEETDTDLVNGPTDALPQRDIRGGYWENDAFVLAASLRGSADPSQDGIPEFGFRVASIPDSSGLLGDYNRNGVVDAADYTVWRDILGQIGTGLAADGNGDNAITQADYDVWKTNFGNHAGSGAGTNAAVPEPSAVVLLILAATGWCLRRRRSA